MDIYIGYKDPENVEEPCWNQEDGEVEVNHEALIDVVKTIYDTTSNTSPLRILCAKNFMSITKDLQTDYTETLLERFVGPGMGMNLIKELLKSLLTRLTTSKIS